MDISQFLINRNFTIHQTLMFIDKNAKQIAILVDSEKKVIGTITDGDIRRALIKGLSLDSSIENIANRNPILEHENQDQQLLLQKMRRLGIRCLPIVDEENRLVTLLFNEITKTQHEAKVLIMAGGKGTRLRPITNSLPKPLIEINGHTIIETLVSRFVLHGFKSIWVSVRHLHDQIERILEDGKHLGAEINYILEDKPLGTAGSYMFLPDEIKSSTVIISNGDLVNSIDFANLVDFHVRNKSIATVVGVEHVTEIPFGVFKENRGFIEGFQEKPRLVNWINAGVNVFEKEAFEDFFVGDQIDIPDVYQSLLRKEIDIRLFKSDEYWRDIGTLENLESARAENKVNTNDF